MDERRLFDSLEFKHFCDMNSKKKKTIKKSY